MSNISRLSMVPLIVVLAAAGDFSGQAAPLPLPMGEPAATPQAAPRPQSPVASTPSRTDSPRAVLDQYCVSCHNERLKTGGLSLEHVNVERPGEAPEIWEKVAHKLRAGEMPPAGTPRPDLVTSRGLAARIEEGLDRAAIAQPRAGSVALHRLNRTEYVNAVRDLLGLEIPVAMLPVENATGGFDNIAGALTVSPMLLERYMTLGRQVSRLAVGDATMLVPPVLYGIDSSLKQRDRLNQDLPFGTRGVTVRHSFPFDGEYVVQLRLRRNPEEYIRGLGPHAQPIDVRLDGTRVRLFDEAGLMKGVPPAEGYSQGDLGDPEWEKNSLDGDGALEARFFAKAGAHVLALSLPARRWQADESFVLPVGANLDEERGGNIAIKTVEISGPFGAKASDETASRRLIFTCRPASESDMEPCATAILERLARRAYRRPVIADDMQTLLQFCRKGLTRGFDGCIQSGIERILTSPHFLFRVPDNPGNAGDGRVARPVALADPAAASRGRSLE